MLINNIKRLRELKKKCKLKDEEDLIKFDKKERAIIDVGAENYDDIYSPFCLYDMNVLDFELEDYLDNKSESIPLEYDLKLVFHIKDANEEKRKEIENTVRQNYENRIYTINRKVDQNIRQSLLLTFVGFALLVLRVWIDTVDIPVFFSAMLDIFSWVSIWSAVDVFFFERKILQLEKIMLYRLINARVEVRDFVPKWALRQIVEDESKDNNEIVTSVNLNKNKNKTKNDKNKKAPKEKKQNTKATK